jgi:hypothetical protein
MTVHSRGYSCPSVKLKNSFYTHLFVKTASARSRLSKHFLTLGHKYLVAIKMLLTLAVYVHYLTVFIREDASGFDSTPVSTSPIVTIKTQPFAR